MATMDSSRLNLTSPPKDNSEASQAQSCLNTLRRHCRECYAQWGGLNRRDAVHHLCSPPLKKSKSVGQRARPAAPRSCSSSFAAAGGKSQPRYIPCEKPFDEVHSPLLFLYISHIIYLD